MTAQTKTNTRVTVENGWAVRNLNDGSQIRARLRPDHDPIEPERGPGMWNQGVTLVRERDGYGGVDLDEHDGLRAVLDRLYRVGRNGWRVDMVHDTALPATRTDWRPVGSDADREEFVRRYLRAFWGVQHASLRHHQGHSQGDWADIWVIVEGVEGGADVDALADATWNEWSAWAKGDVYSVESQTRTLTDAMYSDPSDPDDGWEDFECVGGYYGDKAATAGMAEFLSVYESELPAPYEVTTYE